MSGAGRDTTPAAPSLLSCLLKPRPAPKRQAPALAPARPGKTPREGPSRPSSSQRQAAPAPPPARAAGAAGSSSQAPAAELLPAHQFYGSRPAAPPAQRHDPGTSSSDAHAPAAQPAAQAAWGPAADCPIHRFPLQHKAFAFLDAHPQGPHLRVFAQEASSDGKRSFLVTSPASFWRHYLQVRLPLPALPAFARCSCCCCCCCLPAARTAHVH
jgi:hypothetical protein